MRLSLEISFILPDQSAVGLGYSTPRLLALGHPWDGLGITPLTPERRSKPRFSPQLAGPTSCPSTRMNEERLLTQSFPPASSGPPHH